MDKWKNTFKKKKLIVWGTSRGAVQAVTLLNKNGFTVTAYCDNNKAKHGKVFNPLASIETGGEVFSPEKLKESVSDDCVVIITSFAYEAIYKQIMRMGIHCAVYIYLLYDPCHLKTGCRYGENEKQEICSIYSDDDYTRRLINLIVEKGLLNMNGFLPIKECLGFGGIDEYYYDSIANLVNGSAAGLTLLDVGSYTGESIVQIQSVFLEGIKKIYGFEPNEKNWKEIEKRKLDQFTLFKLGLSNKEGYESFTEEGPFFRADDEMDGSRVQVARLDNLDISIVGRCILKIDIEGSEKKCLEGATSFIRKHRPYIAICVYHREKDILDIPKFIRELVPDYRFYLRGGMHTVCYAFPKEA